MTKEEAKHFSDVLKAYSEGKEIEIQTEWGCWLPISPCNDHQFSGNPMDYRIKPEQKLRPYKDAAEFLNAQKEHGPYYIQIDIKEESYYMLPGNATNTHFITYNGCLCSYSELALSYEWQDGTPCGVVE